MICISWQSKRLSEAFINLFKVGAQKREVGTLSNSKLKLWQSKRQQSWLRSRLSEAFMPCIWNFLFKVGDQPMNNFFIKLEIMRWLILIRISLKSLHWNFYFWDKSHVDGKMYRIHIKPITSWITSYFKTFMWNT
jgi:hypothetical protein